MSNLVSGKGRFSHGTAAPGNLGRVDWNRRQAQQNIVTYWTYSKCYLITQQFQPELGAGRARAGCAPQHRRDGARDRPTRSAHWIGTGYSDLGI